MEHPPEEGPGIQKALAIQQHSRAAFNQLNQRREFVVLFGEQKRIFGESSAKSFAEGLFG
jgi:hypothetical protein